MIPIVVLDVTFIIVGCMYIIIFILLDGIVGGHWPSGCVGLSALSRVIYLWRKDERVGIPHELRCIEVCILLCCKFSTSRNLKETLAKFSRIPRLSLFRVHTSLP